VHGVRITPRSSACWAALAAATGYWTFCHAQEPPANNSRTAPVLSARKTM
jgi:hypothetical protein